LIERRRHGTALAMRKSLIAFALIFALPLPAFAQAPAATVLAGGTRVTDVKIGSGPAAMPGQMVAVHYTGWLWQDGMKGKKFDSSRDRGEPFVFQLGVGSVILGWDEGVAGMQPGGQRTLIVPPDAGYGDSGAGADIPPGATLLFEVELIAAK
jgi:FKBP-type peptidyl-prolyl cis-trans isomerase